MKAAVKIATIFLIFLIALEVSARMRPLRTVEDTRVNAPAAKQMRVARESSQMFATRDGLSTDLFTVQRGEALRFLSRIEGSPSSAKPLAENLKRMLTDNNGRALMESRLGHGQKIFLINLVLAVKTKSNPVTRGQVLRQILVDRGVDPHQAKECKI